MKTTPCMVCNSPSVPHTTIRAASGQGEVKADQGFVDYWTNERLGLPTARREAG